MKLSLGRNEWLGIIRLWNRLEIVLWDSFDDGLRVDLVVILRDSLGDSMGNSLLQRVDDSVRRTG